MKDREYYERLISDSFDEPLPPEKVDELKQAMKTYPGLVEFKQELEKQSKLFRELPLLQLKKGLLPEKPKQRQTILSRIWNIRIAVPLPVAAMLLLLVVGWMGFQILHVGSPERPTISEEKSPVKYVQVIQLEPSAAKLISGSNTTSTSKQEKL